MRIPIEGKKLPIFVLCEKALFSTVKRMDAKLNISLVLHPIYITSAL